MALVRWFLDRVRSLRARVAGYWKASTDWIRGGDLRALPLRVVDWAVEAARFCFIQLWDLLAWLGNLRLVAVAKFLAIVSAMATVLIIAGLLFATYYPNTQIPAHDPVDRIVYLDQGWGPTASSHDRQAFYYTPQGTTLHDLRYSWLANLEMAWSNERFASPENMRSLGFIVDYTATPENPGGLPLGFARRFDTRVGEYVLDLSCATCHSGELDLNTRTSGRVGIRIDGGPAMHAFTAMKVGHFGPNLLAAMASTFLNPAKFNRFARNVLGEQKSGKWALYWNFQKVFWALLMDGWSETTKHLYPVEEGFGRIDAIGRIANRVFGEDLDPANYRPGVAPVSYPAVWDIWKFDWVQYTASVAQPLARNMGESLGVGADLGLADDYGRALPLEQRFSSSSNVDNLVQIEEVLHKLKAPKWPDQILDPIDMKKAAAGKQLFGIYCAHCHQPCRMTDEDRAVLVPDKKPDEPHWHVNYLPVEDIGTDPAAALQFVNNRVDLSKSGLTADEIRPELQKMYQEQQDRDNAYRQSHNLPLVDYKCQIAQELDTIDTKSVSIGAGLNYIEILLRKKYFNERGFSAPMIQKYNGYGAIDLPQVKLVYKARPLAGVWATAPYLHNGSVPTLYEMLIPADQRRKKFFVGRKEFDPVRVGLYAEPLTKNGFWFDTSIPGNLNIGHEFRAGYREYHPGDPPSHGVIGPELTEDERWAIIEYLKIHTDDDAPACQVSYWAPPSSPACELPKSGVKKAGAK